jgi:hypothetical protein
MPAISFPLLGFAVGAGLCWSVAKDLSKPVRPPVERALLVVAAFGLLAFAPAVALVLGAQPDWCLGYRVPARRLPGWLPPLWMLASGLSVPLGFAGGARALRRRSRAFPALWVWPPLALAALALIVAGADLGVVATFAQYRGDYAVRQLWGSSFGVFLGALAAGVGLAAWLAQRSLHYLVLGAVDGA